jgi:YD repeat-containing protein
MPIEKHEYINANEYITTTYSYYSTPYAVRIGLLKQISVEGAITEFNYDFMGRITSVTEPNEAQTFTAYDLKGRVTQITNPDDTIKTNVYNTIANTITSADENGVATVYTYNALGKLLTAR